MRTTENTPHAITTIVVGDKTFEVRLNQLINFLVQIKNRINISEMDDLEYNLRRVSNVVLDGIDEDKEAFVLRTPLVLLHELTEMFPLFLVEAGPIGSIR